MEKTRLTLDIEPALHRKLKIAAARRGTSMRQICVTALEDSVRDDEQETGPLTAEEAPLLAELWDNDEDAIYDELS